MESREGSRGASKGRKKKGGDEEDNYQPTSQYFRRLHVLQQNDLSTGVWGLEENQVYLAFIQENRDDFTSEQARRRRKVFYRLSKLLKKRTPDQCRSHHQKLQLKFRDDIDRIIEHLAEELRVKAEELGVQAFTGKVKEAGKTATSEWLDDGAGMEIDVSEVMSW